ncbi:MAG: hypothetical protein ABI693_15840 [Bryobacteraceae bacterium]
MRRFALSVVLSAVALAFASDVRGGDRSDDPRVKTAVAAGLQYLATLSPSQNVQTLSVQTEPAATASSATNQGLSVSAVMLTWVDAARVIPCTGCIQGSQTATLGISYPLTQVTAGSTYNWIITYNSDTYSGPCAVTFAIIQVNPVRPLGGFVVPASCRLGSVYASWSSGVIPDVSGDAILLGQIVAKDGSAVTDRLVQGINIVSPALK